MQPYSMIAGTREFDVNMMNQSSVLNQWNILLAFRQLNWLTITQSMQSTDTATYMYMYT